eukprot:6527446-Pyramimonas_sp.AAC.1
MAYSTLHGALSASRRRCIPSSSLVMLCASPMPWGNVPNAHVPRAWARHVASLEKTMVYSGDKKQIMHRGGWSKLNRHFLW